VIEGSIATTGGDNELTDLVVAEIAHDITLARLA